MISLDSALKSIELKLAGAVATTELPCVASFVDMTQATFALTGTSEADGTTNGVTAVTAVAAPAATTTRKLNYLSCVNVDTAAVVVTVQVNNNGTKRICFKGTLQVGDQLVFLDAAGFAVFDANGSIKQVSSAAGLLPVASGGTGASTLTGILKGNGVAAVSAIVLPADATKFLDGTGAFTTPAGGGGAAVSRTEPTTGNIAALALPTGTGPLVVYMTNPTLATIQGIAAGTDGQTLTVISQGAGQVNLSHNDAGGTALGKLRNFATSAATPLAAGVGVASYVCDLANTRWNLVAHEQGAWITPTYAGGNYTGSGGGSWTVDSGDVTTMQYWLRGRVLNVVFSLGTTTTATTPAALNIAIPGGFTANQSSFWPFIHNDGGGVAVGYVGLGVGATIIGLNKLAGNWGNQTNALLVGGSITFGVQ